MEAQKQERQASNTPTAAPAGAALAGSEDKKSGLRGLSYDEQVQKLAPDAAAPAAKGAVDDDGGPGATVVRYENDPRYGKPKPAVKVKVADGQQVDENQMSSVKADIQDPEAPGATQHLWYTWAQTGGPTYSNTAGMYSPELKLQAPEVENDEVITGELTVGKRGFIKPRAVETKKPFALKVKNVEKPAAKEEAAPAKPAPAAQAQTPIEDAPGKAKAPDFGMLEALIAAAMATDKPKEQPAPVKAPAPAKEAATPTPAKEAATPTPAKEAATPAAPQASEEAATPEKQDESKAPMPARRRHHHRRRHARHHRHHRGHGHHKPAAPRHPKIARRHGEMLALVAQLLRLMSEVQARQQQPALPSTREPLPKPPIKRPEWAPPKAPPKVGAPSNKALQAGERGVLNTTVVDPDQGKLGGPRVEWRQTAAAQKLEDIKGQGTSQIEFKAPQVSKKTTLTGIVHATDADGLTGQAPFTVTVEPVIAANEKGRVWGDPHFEGGDGGKFDVMGRDGGVYNLHSDTGVRVTGLFKTYKKQGITIVDRVGTIVTGKGPKGVISNQIEYSPTVATIDGKALAKNKSTPLADGGSALLLANRLIIDTREGYKVTIHQRASSGIKYCDVDVQTGARGVGSGADPGGLLGQTFDADKLAKNGKKGEGAQGQGAITGVVTDYETKGLFGAGAGKHAMGGLDAATDERRLFRKTVLVSANPGLGAEGFVDTGLDVQPGDSVLISASGSAGEAKKLTRNPAGDPRYTHKQKSAFMAPAAPAFALVGRVAGEKTGFMVGPSFKGGVKQGGKFQLAFNDLRGTFGDNVGEYVADVQVTKGVA